MFEMFWIQARFHKFGSKASTNAGILLHSVHQKTVFHVRGEHSIFLLGTRETQTAACNRLHKIEQRLARWLLIAQCRVDSGIVAITQVAQALLPVRFSRSLAPKHTWIEQAYNAYLKWSGTRAERSRLVSTPRDRLQYKNPFEEGALLRLRRIQIPAPCKPLAA